MPVPQLLNILRPLVAMHRSAKLALLELLQNAGHDALLQNNFIGDRKFCFPYKELMRIRNYILRLVHTSENSRAQPIQNLLSEITDFENTHAGLLNQLNNYCSAKRPREYDGQNDQSKRSRAVGDAGDDDLGDDNDEEMDI